MLPAHVCTLPAILVFVARIAIASSADPGVLVPGDAAVDGSFLQPYTNAWLYTARMANGETKPQGLWTDQLRFVQRDGRRLLQRVQGTVYVNGLTTSVVNVFDPKTMAPVESQLHGIDGSLLKRDFAGGHVVTTKALKTGAAEERSEIDLVPAPFDFSGGMYGLLIAALPLQTNQDIRLSDIDEFENKARDADVHIGKQEWVMAGRRGRVKAWVATSSSADYKMVFWLTRQPPYIIRLDMHKYDSGTDLRWEML
jgi:hypothetical protein